MPSEASAADELAVFHTRLAEHYDRPEVKAAIGSTAPIIQAVETIHKSFGGSFLGYHSLIYYNGLKPPPAGAHWSGEWGWDEAMGMGTRGDWREFTPEQIQQAVKTLSCDPNLASFQTICNNAEAAFDAIKPEAVSVLQVELAENADEYLKQILADIEKCKVYSQAEIARSMLPSGQLMSRDSLAATQGVRVPPHMAIQANIVAIQSSVDACERLANACTKASAHLFRKGKRHRDSSRIGTNVFIGHGRSFVWRDLKDFIKDRMHLPYDEFNRVPVAGITNIARLTEMLDSAAVAFIVMTAEDETAEGNMQARMNVIHEVGLFQGRLGFTKAIVLLEDTCAEFSNIQGLGQIRFPKGNISAKFEEIRQVLEREGLVEEQRA